MEELWSFTVDPKRSQKRARFNLLTLEHGEYYFQDYSAYFYPPLGAPGSVLRTAGRGTLNGVFDTGMEVRNRPRQQGRLKLCSRGLLFEPADRLLPLVKYPFRHMETQMEPVGVGSMSEAEIRGGGEGFRFRCTVVVESRRNDEVGPYVTKRARDSGTIVEWSDWTFSFSLLHTPVGEFLREARRLREVALRVKEKGHGYEEPLLRPLLEERLRDSTRKFDTIHLVDFRETLLLTCPVRVDRITPLLRNPGCLMITDARVYFQPAELNNVGEPVASFALAGVLRAFKRRHMLRQTGLELVMAGDGGSAFFNFEFSRERDDLFDVLMSQPLVGPRAQSASAIEAETRRWQSGQVSNYDYLVFLNTVAGRTVNDLTQYPVFPWVIKDYHSATLNLDDDTVYRDMSRPIGALDAERLEYFRTRFRNMPDPTQHPGQGIPPPFLYGTHYSTPGYALFFLVRSAPEEMLCLQNGRFDDPDRSFTSIKAAWESVLRNHADLKELIPEFYAGDGSFLTNRDDLQLGVTQGGQRVGDVELPPWARNPRDFVRKMRRALESPHVSRRLHLWIDLVFGCKQRGKAAIEADNLFYYLTYEGAVDLEKIDDPRERAALESQISEFGQCPSQLFVGPHPRRDDTMSSIILAPTFGNPRVGAGGPTKDRRFSGGGERGGGSRDRSPYSEKRLSGSLKEVVDPVALLSSLPPPPSASEYLIENLYEDHFGERMTQLQHHQQQQQKQLRRSSGTSRSYPGEKVLGESRRRGGVAVTTQGWSSFPPTSASSTSPVSPLSPSSPTTSAAATLTVGALWKRGLAIAGAVGGAAAEVTGSRGMASRTTPLQQQQQQRWHATGERQARQGSGDPAPESLPSGFAGGGSGGVVGVRGGVGEWRGSPVARVPTAQANAPTPEEPIWRSNSVSTINKGGFPGDMEGALSQGRGEAILSRGGATALAAAKVPAKPNPGATATSGRGSAQSSAVRGTQSSLPPALALATGSERWWLDAWKVELRPGEPMALHRDGVTCAHLVKDLGEAAGPIAGAEAAVAATTRCAVDGAGEHTGRLTLCTSAKDCSLKICSLEREAGGSGPVSKAHTRRRLAGGELALSCCALTQDGKHAVAGSWDNSILLYSVEAACVLSRVEGAHDDGVSCLALHEPASTSDEKRNGAQRKVHGTKTLMLATGSWDAAVKVWTVQSPEMDPLPVLELFDLETPVQALAIDGTGKALAAAGEDGMVAVWDTATGSLLATFRACPDQCPVVSVRWSESDSGDGGPSPGSGKACLVLASAAGDVCRFSPIGAPLGRLRLDSEVVAMDSDGRCTVVACRDGSLRFLGSLQDGGFVQTVIRGSGHETDMTCLRVCAGRAVSGSSGSAPAVGAVIVTGSDAGAVRLWDVVDRCRA